MKTITIPYKEYTLLVSDAEKSRKEIMSEAETIANHYNKMQLVLTVWNNSEYEIHSTILPFTDHSINKEAQDEIHKTVDKAVGFVVKQNNNLKTYNRLLGAFIGFLFVVICLLIVVVSRY